KGKTSNVSTTTNSEGAFTLNVPATEVLIISYIGFRQQEVPVDGKAMLQVTLTEESSALSEVVVLGYVSQQKKDFTSAVSVVDTEELQKTMGTTVAEKLQGRVPGLRVRTSGLPGQTAQIEIRGVNNFRGTEPLYVIDGLLTNESRDFNP